MSRSFQKPTNHHNGAVKASGSAVQVKSQSDVKKACASGTFAGMAKGAVKVSAVIINGYKTRG